MQGCPSCRARRASSACEFLLLMTTRRTAISSQLNWIVVEISAYPRAGTAPKHFEQLETANATRQGRIAWRSSICRCRKRTGCVCLAGNQIASVDSATLRGDTEFHGSNSSRRGLSELGLSGLPAKTSCANRDCSTRSSMRCRPSSGGLREAYRGGARIVERCAGRRILLAEDNESPTSSSSSSILAEIWLSSAESSPRRCGGQRQCADASYDFILMDCQMPGMDGFEGDAGTIRREEVISRNWPNAYCSPTRQRRQRGSRNVASVPGMDEYAAKPIDTLRLIETIESLLSEASADRCRAIRCAKAAMESETTRCSTDDRTHDPIPDTHSRERAYPLTGLSVSLGDFAIRSPLHLNSLLERCLGDLELCPPAPSACSQTIYKHHRQAVDKSAMCWRYG